MACSKYTIKNTSDDNIYFNYRQCGDGEYFGDVILKPNRAKNFWVIDGSFQSTTSLTNFEILSSSVFPNQTTQFYYVPYVVKTGSTLNQSMVGGTALIFLYVDLPFDPSLLTEGDKLALWINYTGITINGIFTPAYYYSDNLGTLLNYTIPGQTTAVINRGYYFTYYGWYISTILIDRCCMH